MENAFALSVVENIIDDVTNRLQVDEPPKIKEEESGKRKRRKLAGTRFIKKMENAEKIDT